MARSMRHPWVLRSLSGQDTALWLMALLYRAGGQMTRCTSNQ